MIASLTLLYAGLAFAQTSLRETITRTLPASQVGIGLGFFGLSVGEASAIGTGAISRLLSTHLSTDFVVSHFLNEMDPYKFIFILATILVGLTAILYTLSFRHKDPAQALDK
ncbi:hypothetical protein [Neobacillus massiliamazoniensis]|uniref:Major facilitator superfamily (MFS) profile domain-containing protein n=1 Tax=Neobacillus massiliamazoniensis TaxID=1499688 RepID=A0A0U1NYS3_9BACI|nr:hypothetical protein [Neobacillus massiliamazoniensis]CRK83184.1 hypothetical protein BN000_03144 [Neobacillus massiliamazoniensis]